MGLEERTYSVLVVSDAEKFNSAVIRFLPQTQYSPVTFALSVSEAKRLVSERSFDMIIINAPLKDDSGARFAVDCCEMRTTIVMLLVRAEIYDQLRARLCRHGVFMLPKPASGRMVEQALDWMISARERLRDFENKNVTLEEKMEEIRVVNRAKLLLIEELKMTEADAHRYIEKSAMDNCITKKAFAQRIIRMYS